MVLVMPPEYRQLFSKFRKNLHLLRSLSWRTPLVLAIKYTSNCSFSLHEQVTDVGLVQLVPFTHNLNLTLDKVDKFISTLNYLNDGLLVKVALAINFIQGDISVLGIKVGGIWSALILVENFTWDWIYEPSKVKKSTLDESFPYLRNI